MHTVESGVTHESGVPIQLLTKLQYNNNNAGYPGIKKSKDIPGLSSVEGRHTHELLQQRLARDRNRYRDRDRDRDRARARVRVRVPVSEVRAAGDGSRLHL